MDDSATNLARVVIENGRRATPLDDVVPAGEIQAAIDARWPLEPIDATYRGEVAQRLPEPRRAPTPWQAPMPYSRCVARQDRAGWQLDTLNVVALERPLGEATVFAVTIEAGRVDAPTSDPVLIASLYSQSPAVRRIRAARA